MVSLTYLRGLELPELDKEDLLMILLFERNKLKKLYWEHYMNSFQILQFTMIPNLLLYKTWSYSIFE